MKRRHGPKRRGAAMVEMALVLMLLLWLVFGVLEYGWMLIKSQEINGIVRHGARIGSVLHGTHAQVEAAIAESMEQAGLDDVYTIETTPQDLDEVSAGEMFTVTLVLNYNVEGGVTLRLPVPRPGTIRASVTMVKEGT